MCLNYLKKYLKRRNATEMMQVVDFTGLMQACHQIATSPMQLDIQNLLQVVETTCNKLVDKKS